MALVGIAGEQHVQVQQQQFFQRQEAVLAFARQADEPGDLLRDRQQRLQRPPVGHAAPAPAPGENPVLGMNGKGVRRVDGQRRQHRKDVGQEVAFQKFQVARRQLGAADEVIPSASISLRRPVEGRLLGLHQRPRIGVDQRQLFGRAAAVFGQGRVAVAHQRAQAGHADGVEFVQVGGRDRQEAQPFQKRHGGVCRLFQDAPVERQPRKLAVEEPARAGGFRLGQGNRGGEGGFQEIGLGHGWGLCRKSDGDSLSLVPALSSTSAASARVIGRPSASARASSAATSPRAAPDRPRHPTATR
jgi:hypothetical protein